jgi:hypothetical protein
MSHPRSFDEAAVPPPVDGTQRLWLAGLAVNVSVAAVG